MPKKKPPPAPWSVISDAYWARAGSVPEPWSREPKPIRMAVVVGLFHTQMRRNGGQLWITNGYHEDCARELRARLADLGTDTAREVAAMLVELDAIGLEAERLEESEDDESEAAFEDLATRCQAITERYWKLGPTLMAEVDAWLVGTREPGRRARPPRTPPGNARCRSRCGSRGSRRPSRTRAGGAALPMRR